MGFSQRMLGRGTSGSVIRTESCLTQVAEREMRTRKYALSSGVAGTDEHFVSVQGETEGI